MGAPVGFPYLTGREAHEMLLYRPRFRHPKKAARPANLAEAEELSPIHNSVPADPGDFALDVETASGEVLAIDDPASLRQLAARTGGNHSLTLLRSERAMTDCRPISLFSLQTAAQLGDEVGSVLDKRRFRANVYLDLGTVGGFSENAFIGHKLRLGPKVVISVLERDPRCQMITLDPDTAAPNPEVLRNVARGHEIERLKFFRLIVLPSPRARPDRRCGSVPPPAQRHKHRPCLRGRARRCAEPPGSALRYRDRG